MLPHCQPLTGWPRARFARPGEKHIFSNNYYDSILKFFQVDITGMFRMTSSARYFKAGVGSSRPN